MAEAMKSSRKQGDSRSYPGLGHHGGVNPYSCMSGIAPMEVCEELQAFGDLGMADPLLQCPRGHLYTGGLGPLPPQPGGKGYHKNPNGATTRIQMEWVPPLSFS